jgi:hypothetical protein
MRDEPILEPDPVVEGYKDFLKWAKTPEGKKFIADEAYRPVHPLWQGKTISTVGAPPTILVCANMVKELLEAGGK